MCYTYVSKRICHEGGRPSWRSPLLSSVLELPIVGFDALDVALKRTNEGTDSYFYIEKLLERGKTIEESHRQVLRELVIKYPDRTKPLLDKYGINRLPEPETQSTLTRFLLQFHNVLIYVLIAAGVVTAFLEHWVDASVIFGVVILNALIGYVQEGKAENALKGTKR